MSETPHVRVNTAPILSHQISAQTLRDVSLLVFFVIAGVAEAFSTCAAGVWFLSRVVALMDLQVPRLAEAFPTQRTQVWLLARVYALMLLKITGVAEGAAAERTAESLLGPPHAEATPTPPVR